MIISLSVGVICALLLLKAFLGYRRSMLGVTERLKKILAELEEHQFKLNSLVNADLIFAKQLTEINRQFISMESQLQTLENKRLNDGAYQHALRILEMGGNKEEIIRSCHLSNAEADFLLNLNAYRMVIKSHPQMAAAD